MDLRKGVFLALLAAAPERHASAAVLFQSLPDLANQHPHLALCSACGSSYRVFDTFTLDADAAINGISVSLGTAYGLPTGFDVGIFTVVANGGPGTEIWNQTFTASQFTGVTPGQSGDGTNTTSAIYSVNPAGLFLQTGTYDISFYDPANLAVEGFAGGGGKLYQINYASYMGVAGYFIGNESAGFILSDTPTPVPEPATMWLFSLALAGLAAVRMCHRT